MDDAATATGSDASVAPEAGAAADAARDDMGDAAAATLESFVYVGGADWSGQPFPFRSYKLDRQSGALTAMQTSLDLGQNPSYATPALDGRFLYVANEVEGTAAVTVAAIDPRDGRLSRLEQEPLPGGKGVVFTSLDPSGKYVLAADYGGARAAVFRVEADGRLSAPVDIKVFAAGANSHSIRTDPSGRFAYVPNKDLAQVAQFRFDVESGKLEPLAGAATVSAPGGPRHIAFTPDGRYAFVILEYDDKVNAYSVGGDGALTLVDSQSTLPAGFTGNNTGAHVLVHPNGKYVYASNRGHDSIAVYSIDAQGKLSLVQHAPTQGKTPRNFDIDATGQLLVVANQGEGAGGGSLVVFAIGRDGKLTQRGAATTGLRTPQAVAIVTRARRSASPLPP